MHTQSNRDESPASPYLLFNKYLESIETCQLLKMHFIISSIGLIVLSIFVARIFAGKIEFPEYLLSGLYPWAKASAGMQKVSSVMQYVLPVIIIFIYFPVALLISRYLHVLNKSFHYYRPPQIGLFFFLLITINVGLLLVNQEKIAILGLLTVIWIVLLLWLPLSIFFNGNLAVPSWLSNKIHWVWGSVIILIVLHYFSIFIPLIGKPIVIGQDYLNISERTILSNGKVVDNLDYINTHQVGGLQIYDPRKNTAGIQIKVNNCQKFYGTLIDLDTTNREKFECDKTTNTLIVKVPFVSLDEENLKTLRRTETISDEINEFILLNTENKLENQVKRGWFFFHHGYNFGPMSALSLGASSDKQTMVYGWLATVTQEKILGSLGLMSYHGYFKAYFSLFIIYFSVFLLGIWLIYRNLGTVVFAGVLAVSATLILGLELIKLAPGFNPVRHFFDVPVFFLLYRYLSDKRKIYLFSAIALALFAILWSKDMGMFLATSVGGALIIYGLMQRPYHRLPLFAGAITIATGLLLFVYPMPGANPTSIYMLLGVGSPLASSTVILNLIVLVSLLLLATLWLKQTPVYNTLTLGMAFYFVQGLTYFVWYPSKHHLWGVAPVFILWLAALYHGWITHCTDEKKASNRLLLSLGAILLFIYIPASVHFTKERKEYLKHIGNHPLFQWTFERGTFASTMDPSLFEEATQLIKQYSSDNAIYIISKYDHVLPNLAGRYSAMPYNELLTNLVSTREAATAAKAIIDHKPKYLFVDTDIGRGYISGAPKTDSANNAAELAAPLIQGLYSEATSREKIIGGLNDVYLMVTDKYEKCKTGGLITVYCRKSD